MLEETTKVQKSLRRYAGAKECPVFGYHNASTVLPDRAFTKAPGDIPDLFRCDRADPRWPKKCDHCPYLFTPDDAWQENVEKIYRRSDTGGLTTRHEAPPGAMWYATWYEQFPDWCGLEDKRALMVKLPDGSEWHVDGSATNCTDKGNTAHRCWCRHGVPPLVTVDKTGPTCTAGAGSIKTSRWHGFLRNGELISVP
jgi:hypothetical protein